MPLHRRARDQHHRHQPGQHKRHGCENQQKIRPEQARVDVAERIDRRVADIGRARRHERQHANGHRDERVLRFASLQCGAALQRVLHAVADLQSGQRDLPAEELLAEHAHRVLILEEPPRGVQDVAVALAADDIERNEMERRRRQPRLVDHDLDPLGIEHGAGQGQREILSDTNGAAIGLPPAFDRRYDNLRRVRRDRSACGGDRGPRGGRGGRASRRIHRLSRERRGRDQSEHQRNPSIRCTVAALILESPIPNP